uniref:PI-PLC Y-box domain-containing protein n=1 Tax=Megaviridae environmental sample TaxID=1737588 RepID=A0A5J6VM57_9VIRU|nr:MAG: hypothetical protein [Megaviridae environmental sample]
MENSSSGLMKVAKYVVIVLIVITIIVILVFEYKKYSKNKDKCSNIESVYANKIKITQPSNDKQTKATLCSPLKKVAIMGSYNSCAVENFCYSYVDTCSLSKWIKLGIRAVDFEIYSKNGEPVIAVSSDDSYCLKNSYNSIQLKDALKVISTNAFASDQSSMPPFFITLRVKSAIAEIYDKIWQAIVANLSKTLLLCNNQVDPSIFAKPNTHMTDENTPILNTQIKTLMNKIIIIFDSTNTQKNSKSFDQIAGRLSKIIHIYTPVKRFNNISLSTPLAATSFNVAIPSLGCSATNTVTNSSNVNLLEKSLNIMHMNFQSFDDSLQKYLDTFKAPANRDQGSGGEYYSMIPLQTFIQAGGSSDSADGSSSSPGCSIDSMKQAFDNNPGLKSSLGF